MINENELSIALDYLLYVLCEKLNAHLCTYDQSAYHSCSEKLLDISDSVFSAALPKLLNNLRTAPVRRIKREISEEFLNSVLCAGLKHLRAAKLLGAVPLLISDKRYPEDLRAIHDPPIAINVIGDPYHLKDRDIVGVVGSRRATPFSLHQSFKIGRILSDSNLTVVSGGAYGCDISAHLGVLSSCISPVPAIVVFAGGIDELYPRGNSKHFEDLKESQALFISERLCGHRARPCDFPVRNRIIAGLSKQVIVVQAHVRSGAMLTANKALDYGRDVYVLLHHQQPDTFEGNVKLILDGALGFHDAEGLQSGEFFSYRSLKRDIA